MEKDKKQESVGSLKMCGQMLTELVEHRKWTPTNKPEV